MILYISTLQLTVESSHGGLKKVNVVKEATKYLLTDLKPDLEYTVKVQSYTAAGSSPKTVQKSAKTKKKPTVTGKSNGQQSTVTIQLQTL